MPLEATPISLIMNPTTTTNDINTVVMETWVVAFDVGFEYLCVHRCLRGIQLLLGYFLKMEMNREIMNMVLLKIDVSFEHYVWNN